MNQKIISIIALTTILLFAFSGCIQLEMNLKVKEDGKGDMAILMDMTGVKSAVEGMYGSLPEEQKTAAMTEIDANYSKENICKTLLSSAYESQASQMESAVPGGLPSMDLKDAKCEAIDDYKARLLYEDIDIKSSGILEIEEGLLSKKYTLTLGNDGNTGAEDTSAASVGQLKAMGMSMVMNIEMPGEIKQVTPEIGEIDDEKKNTLSIDLLTEASKLNSTKTTIVSETTNMLPIIAGAIIGLVVLVAIVGLVLVVMKKSAAK